jgi:hydrogenase maturation protease
MSAVRTRCLILACGNTLRSDDGVGPRLAEWAAEWFRNEPEVRVVSRLQWTPELAEDIARAESVLFIDCSQDSAPGLIHMAPVEPGAKDPVLATHRLGAAELLALSRELYAYLPRNAFLLTIGAGSTELSEELTAPVKASLPRACDLLKKTVLNLLAAELRTE